MPYKDAEKQAEYQHQYYTDRKEKVRLGQIKLRQLRRDYVQKLKEANPCKDCGKFIQPHAWTTITQPRETRPQPYRR